MSADQFAEDCKEAQESPAKENSFRRYRLNQWTESDVRWLSLEKWDACAGVPKDLEGKTCYAGLDLSSTTDLSALVLVFPEEESHRFDVLAYFWVPEEGARRRERRDRVPYGQWIREGHIEATPGEAIDYAYIRKRINELGKTHHIERIAIDRWNATQLATELEQDGFNMVAFGQGFASMSWPAKKLDAIVLSEQLRHGGNPVLRWMAANVSLETDAADNWKPSKKKSRERIDGIVALIMALEGASQHDEFSGGYWIPADGVTI
jgi:phage terminase large subunit-like protein